MSLKDFKFFSVKISTDYVKTYSDAAPVIKKLSLNQRRFLDFLLQRMSNENRVFNSKETKKKFKKEYGLNISDNTINKYFVDFVKMELMKKMGRSKYFINPMFFAKSSDIMYKEIKRDKLVREYYELYDRPTKINPERHRLMTEKEAMELQEEEFKKKDSS